MTSVKLSFNNLSYVNGLKPDNETYLCGESYWTGVEHEVKGCNFKDDTIPNLMKGIAYVTDNDSLRLKVKSEADRHRVAYRRQSCDFAQHLDACH